MVKLVPPTFNRRRDDRLDSLSKGSYKEVEEEFTVMSIFQ